MNVNEKKFTEVFVDLMENDKIVSANDNLNYRFSKIDSDEYMPQFEDFLFDKMDELEDDFDKWFEDLTFDTIDKKDIIKYHLPEEKIVIEEVNSHALIYKICELIKETHQNIKSVYTGDKDIIFGYSIEDGYFDYTIAHFKGGDKKIYDKIKRLVNDLEKQINGLMSTFNKSQNVYSLYLDSRSSNAYIAENMSEDEIQERTEYKNFLDEHNVLNFKIISFNVLQDVFIKKSKANRDIDPESFGDGAFTNIEFVTNYNVPTSDERLSYL